MICKQYDRWTVTFSGLGLDARGLNDADPALPRLSMSKQWYPIRSRPVRYSRGRGCRSGTGRDCLLIRRRPSAAIQDPVRAGVTRREQGLPENLSATQ